WISSARDKNPRLLVPYLARLDQLGYEMYRDRVAQLGGIRHDQLDRAVVEARNQRAARDQARNHIQNLPVPWSPNATVVPHNVRRTPVGRTPGRGGGGCATIMAMLMLGVSGLVAWFAVDIAGGGGGADDLPPPPCIETRWLSVQTFDSTQTCIYWAS